MRGIGGVMEDMAWAWPLACALLLIIAAGLGVWVLYLRKRLHAKRERFLRSEERVREETARMESLAEFLPQAIWLGGADGRIDFMNRRFAEISGRDRATGAGRGAEDSVHPEDMPRFVEARRQTIEAGVPTSIEVRLRTPDGPYRWWQLRVVPRRDAEGKIIQWIGSYTDIHAMKEAEAELRQSEQRYRQILDTSHDAVLVIDRGGVIRYANVTAESIFGYPLTTLVGSPLSRLQPQRMRDGHVAGMSRYLATGERHLNWRGTAVYALHRDGHEFPVEVSFAEIQSEGDRMFVGFVRDTSEQQQAELERKALELRLRDAQKMEAIGTLAGGIAHAFNNALATILGNLSLAIEESAPLSPELRHHLDEIRLAAARARALVRQILTFSQQQQAEPRRCDLAQVMSDAVAFLRGALPVRVPVSLACEGQIPAVIVDPQQIELVLVSLAMNAVEAIGSGVGRIDVRVDALTLDDAQAAAVSGLKAGRHARIRVEDTGSGMDAETLRRIFEPFFTTGRPDSHAGIGLSVVHGVVAAHGGGITAESTPGRGSCFTIYLPAAPEGEAPSLVAPPGEALTPPARGARILYVDDEPALVGLVQRMLERRGHRVTVFTDAEEALAAAEASADDFDIVLTDYNMPKLSGLDLARALRRLRPGLPVAILSGYVNETLRREAAAAGVRDVLYKEDLVERLCDSVDALVARRRARSGP